MNYVLILK